MCVSGVFLYTGTVEPAALPPPSPFQDMKAKNVLAPYVRVTTQPRNYQQHTDKDSWLITAGVCALQIPQIKDTL